MNTNHDGKQTVKKAKVEKVVQHVDKAKEAAREFYDEARDATEGLAEAVDLKGRVGRNPYGMVALALGTGYLLGGGLFTKTTGRLFRLGLKVAAVPMVRDELLTFAETAIDGVLDQSRKMKSSSPASKTKE